MKILTVVDNDSVRETLVEHLHPLGFEFIHYTNPLKAMDNIVEIAADVVIFSAQDFPRHWKPFMVMQAAAFPENRGLFILLKGENFTFDEASKASHMEVSGLFHENLDSGDMEQLYDLLGRKNLLFEHRLSRRYTPRAFDEIDFIFTHPRSLKIISGTLLDLSPGGLSFRPDNPQLTTDLEGEEKIDFCSLSLADEVLTISVCIVRNNETLAMRFEDLGEMEKTRIKDYIQDSIERALRAHKRTYQKA